MPPLPKGPAGFPKKTEAAGHRRSIRLPFSATGPGFESPYRYQSPSHIPSDRPGGSDRPGLRGHRGRESKRHRVRARRRLSDRRAPTQAAPVASIFIGVWRRNEPWGRVGSERKESGFVGRE